MLALASSPLALSAAGSLGSSLSMSAWMRLSGTSCVHGLTPSLVLHVGHRGSLKFMKKWRRMQPLQTAAAQRQRFHCAGTRTRMAARTRVEALLDGLRVVQVAAADPARQVLGHAREVHGHLPPHARTYSAVSMVPETMSSRELASGGRTLDVSAANALQYESSSAAVRPPTPRDARGEDAGVDAADEPEEAAPAADALEDRSLMRSRGKMGSGCRQNADRCSEYSALIVTSSDRCTLICLYSRPYLISRLHASASLASRRLSAAREPHRASAGMRRSDADLVTSARIVCSTQPRVTALPHVRALVAAFLSPPASWTADRAVRSGCTHLTRHLLDAIADDTELHHATKRLRAQRVLYEAVSVEDIALLEHLVTQFGCLPDDWSVTKAVAGGHVDAVR
jgi:hypothetical protein